MVTIIFNFKDNSLKNQTTFEVASKKSTNVFQFTNFEVLLLKSILS